VLIAATYPNGAPPSDAPERIVLELVAGLLAPQAAVEQIRQLAQAGAGGTNGHTA
jgi:hypothetical protein